MYAEDRIPKLTSLVMGRQLHSLICEMVSLNIFASFVHQGIRLYKIVYRIK